MPENSVTTTFFADEKAAAEAITRLEKKYDDLENKLRHVHRESKEGGAHAIEALKELGTFAVSAGLGFTTAMGAVEKFSEVVREARRDAEEAAKAQERLQTRLNIQTGQFGVGGRQNREAVELAAFGAAKTPEEISRLFVGLRRGGLTDEEARGAIGSQSKAFAAAFEASGGALTPEAFANAMTAALDKQAAKTPQALGQSGRDVFAALQGTNLQAEDIGSAAQILSTLGAGKGRERHARALQQIGLKLSDVDLQGEGLFEAVGKIRGGLDNVPAERRQILLQEIFGDAGLGNRLIGAEGAMGGKRGLLEPAVAAATGGRDAEAKRAGIDKALRDAANADENELAFQALDIQLRESGMSDFRRSITMQTNRAGISAARALGITSGTGPEAIEGISDNPQRVREIEQELREGKTATLEALMEKQNETLAEIRDAVREGNRDGKGKPRRQVEHP